MGSLGDGRFGGLVLWGIFELRDYPNAGFSKCGITQMRDFRNAGLNPALFQCGIVVLLTLANCLKLGPAEYRTTAGGLLNHRRCLASSLKPEECLSTEPPQVVCQATAGAWLQSNRLKVIQDLVLTLSLL